MVDKTKVINFLQDFGCAKLEHLQILYNSSKKDNFNSILNSNMVSKKGDIFVHNTKNIDNTILIALDALCKLKYKLKSFYLGYYPVAITFLSKDNEMYHIIVADKESQKGVVKLVNAYPLTLPRADKLILMFPDSTELENIHCEIPFMYATYPGMEIINKKHLPNENLDEGGIQNINEQS